MQLAPRGGLGGSGDTAVPWGQGTPGGLAQGLGDHGAGGHGATGLDRGKVRDLWVRGGSQHPTTTAGVTKPPAGLPAPPQPCPTRLPTARTGTGRVQRARAQRWRAAGRPRAAWRCRLPCQSTVPRPGGLRGAACQGGDVGGTQLPPGPAWGGSPQERGSRAPRGQPRGAGPGLPALERGGLRGCTK